MKLLLANLIIFISLSTSGCSVYMAAKQPDKLDLSILKVGTHRSLLIAEFGKPIHTETKDNDEKYEIFSFVQGYSGGAKAGRAVFHGAADVLTLGLWEVIGTPTESAFDGDKMVYEVHYDKENRIDEVKLIKNEAEDGPEKGSLVDSPKSRQGWSKKSPPTDTKKPTEKPEIPTETEKVMTPVEKIISDNTTKNK